MPPQPVLAILARVEGTRGACRHPVRQDAVSDVVDHARAGPDVAARADADAIPQHRADAEPGLRSDLRPPADVDTRAERTAVADRHVVTHRALEVHDAVPSDGDAIAHDRPSHHDRSRTDDRGRADDGTGIDEGFELVPRLLESIEQPLATERADRAGQAHVRRRLRQIAHVDDVKTVRGRFSRTLRRLFDEGLELVGPSEGLEQILALASHSTRADDVEPAHADRAPSTRRFHSFESRLSPQMPSTDSTTKFGNFRVSW